MSMIHSLLIRGINGAVRALEKLETKTKRELKMLSEKIREDIDRETMLDLPGRFEWDQLELEQKLELDMKVNGMRLVADEIDKIILRDEWSARLKLEEILEMKREIDGTFKKVRAFLHQMDQWKRRSTEQSNRLLPKESSSGVIEGSCCLCPNHCRVPHEDDHFKVYATPNASVSTRDKEQRVAPSELMELEYKYSIPKCMEEYRSIGRGFTSREDMKVYHLFKDKDNREFFLSLEDGKRAEWLRNMLYSFS